MFAPGQFFAGLSMPLALLAFSLTTAADDVADVIDPIRKAENSADDVPDVTSQLIKEVNRIRPQPFLCEFTGVQPRQTVTEEADESQTICSCDTCQRWATRSLSGLTTAVRMVKHRGEDQVLRMLNNTIGMLDIDHGGMVDRRMEKARELGVLDEWIEYTYGKRALWPDRCAITRLPSDKALAPTKMPLCNCKACQTWALTTIRDLHTQVVIPLRNRDRDKALAAIQQIIATE